MKSMNMSAKQVKKVSHITRISNAGGPPSWVLDFADDGEVNLQRRNNAFEQSEDNVLNETSDPCTSVVMESELDASNPEVDWEFLDSPPDWFLKLSGCRKALVEANPANMFDVSVSSNALWHGIIDLGSPAILRSMITLEEMQHARSHVVRTLDRNQWKTLDAGVERCFKSLNQLSQQDLIEVAKIIRLHGISGGIAQIRKVSMSNPTKPTTEFKFFNDDSSQFNIEGDLIKTEDLEIEEFATSWKPCDTERDTDMFLKRYLFQCLNDVVDTHFGEAVSRASRKRRKQSLGATKTTEGYHLDWLFTSHEVGRDLAYGREFGFCETAGSKT
ncbi:unnamed protein product [Umbelopsis vinacea]